METIDKLKMLFGFVLLGVLAALGGITAIGHVHQDASYGFDFIIGTLTTMGGAFANWAFGTSSRSRPQDTAAKPTTGGESGGTA